MIYKIFSIKDVVVGAFSDILIFPNTDVAKRYFKSLCAESKVKNDLQLFALGSYNSVTGEIESDVTFLMGGSDE